MIYRVTFALVALTVLAHSEEPSELTRTRSSYQAELNRATKPITDKYRAYLETQKAAATKAGKLEVALAYDNELQALTSGPSSEAIRTSSSSPTDDLKAALSGTMWTCTSGTILAGWKIQLQQSGDISLTKSNGQPGWDQWTWYFDEKNELVFKIPNQKKPNEARLSKKLDRLTLSWEGTSVFVRDDKK